VGDNPNIIANWTVVDVQYYIYAEPKTINYEILSEQKQLNVNYHAVKVTIDGDLSQYIKE
jgi:hypothetical protein